MLKLLFKIFTAVIFFISLSLDCGGNLKGEGSHDFYLYSKSSQSKIITLSESEADYFFYFKRDLKGECVVFYDIERVENLLLDLSATKIFTEKGEDFYCEYYYSPKISNCLFINGEKVNLHVSYSNNNIRVATPLIFGSF